MRRRPLGWTAPEGGPVWGLLSSAQLPSTRQEALVLRRGAVDFRPRSSCSGECPVWEARGAPLQRMHPRPPALARQAKVPPRTPPRVVDKAAQPSRRAHLCLRREALARTAAVEREDARALPLGRLTSRAIDPPTAPAVRQGFMALAGVAAAARRAASQVLAAPAIRVVAAALAGVGAAGEKAGRAVAPRSVCSPGTASFRWLA